MPVYWIDANVFIEADASLYPPKNFPSFWKLIDQLLADKIIGTSEMVYREIANYGSDLGQWMKTRKQNGLCIPINPEVEDYYTKIAEYVQSRYDNPNANEFLRGADGMDHRTRDPFEVHRGISGVAKASASEEGEDSRCVRSLQCEVHQAN